MNMRVEHQVEIARSIEDVFAYITIPENTGQWMAQILSVTRISSNPMEVGSTWRHTVETLGRTYDVVFEATEYEPPTRVSVHNRQGPFDFHGTHSLESVPGGTRLTFTIEGDTAGFFRLTDALTERAIKRQFATDFATLKDLLEGDTVVPIEEHSAARIAE